MIQHYSRVPHTSTWKKGKPVKGNLTIKKGTAIATFVNGKYQNNASGNHAALYVSQDAAGIWVIDQWKSEKKLKVSKRRIQSKGKWKDGRYIDPSNNADAFSVID